MKEKIKKVTILIIVIGVIYFGYNIFFDKDTYKGFYYPNGCLVCEKDYIISPNLNSAEDCVKWTEGIKSQSENPNDIWECGKNCKPKIGFYVCEETFGEEGTGVYY